MYRNATINLIKSTSHLPENLEAAENRFVIVSYIVVALSLFILFGILGTNLYLKNQLNSLISVKTELVKQIESMKDKEGQYLVIKSRLDSIKVLQSKSKSVGKVIDLAFQINPPPVLRNLVYSEEESITLTFSMTTLTEARNIIGKLTEVFVAGKIKNPTVQNINIKPDKMSMTVSFVPVLAEL